MVIIEELIIRIVKLVNVVWVVIVWWVVVKVVLMVDL